MSDETMLWVLPALMGIGLGIALRSLAHRYIFGHEYQPLFAMIGAAIVSATLLAAALYVILVQGTNAENAKWAYGVIGTITGYWLRR